MPMTCKDCEEFIPHITEINEHGFEIWGYGCMLGGNHLSRQQYFNLCEDFKLKSKSLR